MNILFVTAFSRCRSFFSLILALVFLLELFSRGALSYIRSHLYLSNQMYSMLRREVKLQNQWFLCDRWRIHTRTAKLSESFSLICHLHHYRSKYRYSNIYWIDEAIDERWVFCISLPLHAFTIACRKLIKFLLRACSYRGFSFWLEFYQEDE